MKDFAPRGEAGLFSVEAEQQLLGAILCNNDLFHKVGSMLAADHFYEPLHGRVWKNIAGRIAADHVASPVTLKVDFEGDEALEVLGGAKYFVRMAGAAIGSFAVADYARMIADLAAKRKMVETLAQTRDAILSGLPLSDAQSELELFLHQAQGEGDMPRSMSLLAANTKSVAVLNEQYSTGRSGIPTGLDELDKLIGGLHRQELTLIAGSTSMGKTAMGVYLAHHAATNGYGVGFASLEMSEVALAQRIGSIDSQIPYQALRHDFSEATFRKVVETVKAQEALPIYIYSDRVRDIPSIMSETKRLQRIHAPHGPFKGIGLLVLDYIQLVRGKGQNSLEVLGKVAIDAKQVAKSLDLPVVALAQVDRGIAKRESQVPFLSDLRGSGDLEFAADNVIFCHRPAYYLERALQNPPKNIEERADMEAALSACRGTMDLIVAKQRMGPIGQCRVACDMGTNRFWNLGFSDLTKTNQQEIAF